jgi:acyl-CoA synthetase (AMP-forming)/AMP-acid ligase II
MPTDREPSKIAINACTEGGKEIQDITWSTLHSQTDRVAGVASNRLETMVACLATLSIRAL